MANIPGQVKPLRIAVIAHALRVGGGRAVGLNLFPAITHNAPRHTYLVTVLAGSGQETALLESYSSAYLDAVHFNLPILENYLDSARCSCGDGAIYFDPWKPESVRDAILAIRNNPELAAEVATRTLQSMEGTVDTQNPI